MLCRHNHSACPICAREAKERAVGQQMPAIGIVCCCAGRRWNPGCKVHPLSSVMPAQRANAITGNHAGPPRNKARAVLA